MRTIAIAGVGLIGGSLGLALRKYGWMGRILGVSSPRTIDQAIALGAIDEGVTLEEAADRADIIYLAQPISVILSSLDRLAAIARPGCLITDAGSTKTAIVERARSLPAGVQFLGGHPLAGKEARGVASADPDLFVGRTYVLTPRLGGELQTPLGSALLELLTVIRCNVLVETASKHDSVVALTSHLPQLASTAIASVVADNTHRNEELAISGPGLIDTTRLALSSWDVWGDIVATNTAAIEHALDVYIDKLTEMRQNLQTQRLGEVFAQAADSASRIRRSTANPDDRGGRSCE